MPTIPFTVRKLESLKAPITGRVDYWDEDLPGFGLRISSTGKRTWMAMYRVRGGHQRRLKLGTSPPMALADARQAAHDALHAVQHGKDPAEDRDANRAADTMKGLVELYVERAKKHKRSWKNDERMLKKDVVSTWGSRKANSIRRRDIIQLLDKVALRGPIMANRTLEVIRTLFSFALERDIVDAHPCIGIKKPGVETPGTRVLSPDEIRSVWTAAEALPLLLGATLKLRLITAQRDTEIRAMRWDELEPRLERATDIAWWTIPGAVAKNGKPHRVPLTVPALNILRTIRKSHNSTDWVFLGKAGKHVVARWEPGNEVREKSGVTFTPRDLRRTVATSVASMGFSRSRVSQILNHTDPSAPAVTGVYDRYSYDLEKKQALEAWAQRLTEILEGRDPASNVVNIARAAG